MEEKGVSLTVVLFPLLFCVVLLSVLLVPSVGSNPILINTNLLWLQGEDIKIDVISDDDGYTAQVIGAYPFRLSGYASEWDTGENLEEILKNLEEGARGEMKMQFPVPPNSENILVELFGEDIEWEWADNEYATELGNFPMLKWTFRIPESMITTTIDEEKWGSVTSDVFTLVVRYTHRVPLENERHVILYALGTGRYLSAYNWWKLDVSAYIETKLPEEVEIVGVKLTKFEPYIPPEFNIDEENNRIITTCLLGHDTGDYVVEFTPPPGVSVSISPGKENADRGQTVTFTVTVTNTGATTDTYDLEVTESDGWVATLDDNLLEDVESGTSEGATLSVIIPSDAEDGGEDTIIVTATSRVSAEVSDSGSGVARCVVGVERGEHDDLAVPLAISAFLIGAAILVMAYLLRVRPKKAARRRVLRV